MTMVSSRSTCPADAPSRPAASEQEAALTGALSETRCRYMPVAGVGGASTERVAAIWLLLLS
jgi:hypothetical protein